jgi:hypothetical protein
VQEKDRSKTVIFLTDSELATMMRKPMTTWVLGAAISMRYSSDPKRVFSGFSLVSWHRGVMTVSFSKNVAGKIKLLSVWRFDFVVELAVMRVLASVVLLPDLLDDAAAAEDRRPGTLEEAIKDEIRDAAEDERPSGAGDEEEEGDAADDDDEEEDSEALEADEEAGGEVKRMRVPSSWRTTRPVTGEKEIPSILELVLRVW